MEECSCRYVGRYNKRDKHLIRFQEFVDARRLHSLQNAPQVMYSNREPPLEIRHLPGLKNGEDWGYVTFGIYIYSFFMTCLTQSFSSLPSPLCKPIPSSCHYQPYPALPRLLALPHQVLQGLHALSNEIQGCRIP